MRLDQTKGCVLPKLPPGGEKISCHYSDSIKIVCSLKCYHEEKIKQNHCYLHYGKWHGYFLCKTKKGTETHHRPIQKMMQCRHQKLTGCLIPASMENSSIECSVTSRASECRVRCGEGKVSPGDWAQCVRDR